MLNPSHLKISGFATAVLLGLAACGGGAAAPVSSPASPAVAPSSAAAKPSTPASVAASPPASVAAAPAVSSAAAKPAVSSAPPISASASPASTAAKPSPSMAAPTTKGTLTIVSPKDGAKITSTDIPVEVQVKDFKLAPADVGRPDKADEGHIHVMLDGMNMGVLFNFYAEPKFTLPGQGIKPGKHKLIFDLATNTHEDMPSTVKEVEVDYQPTTPKAAPQPATTAGKPEIRVLQPADNTTVGPKFTMQFQTSNFTPSTDLEGKPNIKGYGHIHVFVDMAMPEMEMSASPAASGAAAKPAASMAASGGEMEMMSMAGMIGMPGSNSFSVDLSAWPAGKHTLTAMLVQNDHTPLEGAEPAMVHITLQGTGGSAAPAASVKAS